MIAGFFIVLHSIPAGAQEKNLADVPIVVLTEFTRLFPGATYVKWKQEEGNYEGRFTFENREMSAVFSPKGVLAGKEVFLKITELPAPAREYLQQHYAGLKFMEIAEVSNAKGSKLYEVESEDIYIFFDSKGKFLSQMNKEEGGEEEED
jgi:hypothetical protein